MKRFGSFLALISLYLLSSTAAFAAFSFTEVMYDASGTDTKHEWVELINSGPSVDVSGYKFFENGSNHGLTLVAGSASIASGGYVVIADDATTFLTDYPSFSGTLFDAAFSLSNTGETFSFRDESLTDVASATYASDAGAAGDGNTLNYLGGVWVPRLPTPGGAAATGSAPPESSGPGTGGNSSSSSSSSSSTESSSTGAATDEPHLTVDAGADRSLVVGAGAVFTATALGTKGEPLATGRYVWNFGNAATREGKSVMYAYTIPGTYTVTVDVSSAQLGATDRLTVTVVPADIVVTRANAQFVELHNRTSRELDLSLWQLAAGGVLFVLPPHTLIGANKAVAFPSEVTKLLPTSPAEVVLYYPNGVQAATVAPEVTYASAPVSAPTLQKKSSTAKPKATPRVLGAAIDGAEERGKQAAAAIESTSPEWAWFSFLLLGLIVLGGLVALAYVQFKK